MRTAKTACLIATLGGLLLVPGIAVAQGDEGGAIAGVVRDTTGAVLPGVTAEAASPALIEKVRTAVTDAEGQYKIVNLRPGTYTVTFTLPGFSQVRREGLELSTGFTVTANAELRVGSLEETITVSGATPVVDVQNVRAQSVLPRQVLESLPVAKDIASYSVLTAGASGEVRAVGGAKGEGSGQLQIHGAGVGLTTQDGMNIAMSPGASTGKGYFTNFALVQEVVVFSQASAEIENGGLNVNLVTKDGGNTVSGVISTAYTQHGLQTNNLTDALRARGVPTPNSVNRIYDTGGAVGGPFKRDKVWFYAGGRTWGAEERVAGVYFNKLTQPTLFYEPDFSRPALFPNNYYDASLKVTAQIAQRHKVTVSQNQQYKCNCYIGLGGPSVTVPTVLRTPEATSHSKAPFHGAYVTQASWSYPASNRLMFEAGWMKRAQLTVYERPEEVPATARSVVDVGLGLEYGSKFQGPGSNWITEQGNHGTQFRNITRFAMSYITGSHAFKTGLVLGWSKIPVNGTPNFPVQYTFLNRVPIGLTQTAVPHVSVDRLKAQDGFYAQDQWTLRRLTLNLGLRFDYLNGYAPAQVQQATDFTPEFRFDAKYSLPNWWDVSPRFGAAYDLFGNGKTALKVAVGRYVLPEAFTLTSAGNPANAISTITTRTWDDINGNYVPDCDLRSPLGNGECGAMANRTFGTIVPVTRYADDVLNGWGVRPYTWQVSTSVQHELRPRVGLTLGYFRTWVGNFRGTDNQFVTPADYDPYCVTVPVDARLPGGGGNQLCGLYDLNPARFGQVDNVVSQAAKFGKYTQEYNGADITISARYGAGGLLTGGISVGRTVTDDCNVVIDSPQKLFCHAAPPWSNETRIKIAGVYPLPWWGISASAIFQNLPGTLEQANVVFTNAQIAPSLGRNLGACGARVPCTATQTVTVTDPVMRAEPRQNQVDFRLAKTLQVGRLRMQPWFDTYNLFNANPVLRVSNTYGASWPRPTDVLGGRLVKFGADVNF